LRTAATERIGIGGIVIICSKARLEKISPRLEPSADKLRLSLTVGPEEIAMLAEMYLLRLETSMRALEEAARAENARFVPLPRDAFRVDQARVKEKNS
jgi:hypothetical protein